MTFDDIIKFLQSFKTKEEERSKSIIELWEEQSFFCLEEIVSKDVFTARGSKALELFNENALRTLLELRQLFGTSMTVNNWKWRGDWQFRGFRPWSWYKKQSYSQHAFGNAFDFDVKGLTAEEARQKIIGWKKEGKLQYLTCMELDVNWVHIDCRISNRLDENGLFLFKP